MQKELPKHYHNVNFLNIFQTQTFSKQLLLNRLLWNLVPKTAHFLGYILNLYVFSRLIISISRQITDIYPAPSSNYPVTLSGGEPLLQPDFAAEILRL